MTLSRTKIDRNLSQAQRGMLIDWLLERSSNPTGRQVELGLRELDLWSVAEEPSAQSINEWLRKSLSVEISRRELRSDAEAARIMAEAATGSLAQANKLMLDAMLFDMLRKKRAKEEVSQDEIFDLTLAIRRATESVQSERKTDAALKLTDAKLAELAAERERKANVQAAMQNAQKGGGITEETIKHIEELIGLL